MSEIPESATPSAPAGTAPATAPPKPYWLYRFAAWVGIVAGIVFTVAVVFLSGAKLTHGYGHHHHHHHGAMMQRGHHGHGPQQDGPGPAGPGPSEVPQSAAPSPPGPPGR